MGRNYNFKFLKFSPIIAKLFNKVYKDCVISLIQTKFHKNIPQYTTLELLEQQTVVAVGLDIRFPYSSIAVLVIQC